MEERILKLESIVQKQQEFIDSLLNDVSIPKPVQDALERRMRVVKSTPTSVTAADITVVADGIAVTKEPTGVEALIINNRTVIIATYN